MSRPPGPARVGIVALLQESNTFQHQVTTLEHFRQDLLACGEQVRHRLEGSHHEVGGFFAGLHEVGFQAVPVFAARAYPFGVIAADALDALLSQMLAALDRAGPLDGLLVAPHGATVSESFADVDGHWLRVVRERVGPKVPIIGTLDSHANLSPAMVDACQALIAYRSNPHIDQWQCGYDAAQLLARTLRGEISPVMAAEYPPLAIGIERQHTGESPCSEILKVADQMLTRPNVLSNSVILGFPYADVPEMGSSVIAVCDQDHVAARDVARDLARTLWSRRHDLVGQFVSPVAAVEQALACQGRVCLLDMGDNVGGGAHGDGTMLPHELLRRSGTEAFACLYDPQAVQQLQSLPLGSRAVLDLGGKSDPRYGAPLSGDWTLVSRHTGQFSEPHVRHGGIGQFDQGPTAVLRADQGLIVMVTSRRMVPFSLNQLRSCGLSPDQFKILVAKGVNAPVAAYREVCDHFIRVDTPGITCADMTQLDYRCRRRPLFPFERDTPWE